MRSWLVLLAVALGLPAAAQQPTQRCIDLRTDLARYYGCLNDDLQRLVPARDDRRAADPPLPYSAASPSYQVGGFSIAGTRQMLGRNFGISNKPDRVARTTAPSALFQGR